MNVRGADPFVMFDKHSGYYYVYSTSNVSSNNKTFYIYRSKDLVSFEFVDYALDLDKKNWAKDWYWAPEVYHNEKTGIYFLFYSARLKDELTEKYFLDPNYEETCKIGVAVSRSPNGPFINISDEPIAYYPYDPDYLDIYPLLKDTYNPNISFEEAKKRASRGVYISSIDANVFFDEDNRIYLYYSRCCYRNYVYDKKEKKFIEESNILGVELDDAWWNDENGSTVPQVTSEFFNKYGDGTRRKDGFVSIINYEKESQEWENGHINDSVLFKGQKKDRRWSEGSTTFYKNIKGEKVYFITYSCNNFENEKYGVGIAYSSSPLGNFKKYKNNPIIKQNVSVPVYSTGHGSFVNLNGDLVYLLHGRENPKENRILYWVKVLIVDTENISTCDIRKCTLI